MQEPSIFAYSTSIEATKRNNYKSNAGFLMRRWFMHMMTTITSRGSKFFHQEVQATNCNANERNLFIFAFMYGAIKITPELKLFKIYAYQI